VEYHAGLDTLREEKRRNEKEYKKISSLQILSNTIKHKLLINKQQLQSLNHRWRHATLISHNSLREGVGSELRTGEPVKRELFANSVGDWLWR